MEQEQFRQLDNQEKRVSVAKESSGAQRQQDDQTFADGFD
jgi:hypothetical protein